MKKDKVNTSQQQEIFDFKDTLSKLGPKNSCAEMSQSFRSQKMVVLIVFSTLELV